MDFSSVKAITIPEGSVKKITAGGVVIWQKPPTYTNLVPTAFDGNRNILNGVGYARGYRLSDTLAGKYANSTFMVSGADYTTIGIMGGIGVKVVDIYVYGLDFNGRVGDVIGTYRNSDLWCKYSKRQFKDGYADSTKFVVTKLANYYFKLSFNFVEAFDGIAISGVTVSGVTPIVTKNEPIF